MHQIIKIRTTLLVLFAGVRTAAQKSGMLLIADRASLYYHHGMTPPYAPMATILEGAMGKGMRTGLASTSTIAAFVSHVPSRYSQTEITKQLVYNNIDVVLLLPGNRYCTNGSDWGLYNDCLNLTDVLVAQAINIFRLPERCASSNLVGTLRGIFITRYALDHHMGMDPSADAMSAIGQCWNITIIPQDALDALSYMDSHDIALGIALSHIVTDRYTPIGYSTDGHTGGMVPLWMFGTKPPRGLLDNIASIVTEYINVDLDKVTRSLFVDTGRRMKYTDDDTHKPALVIEDIVFPCGRNIAVLGDGEEADLPGVVTICSDQRNTKYISKAAVRVLSNEGVFEAKATYDPSNAGGLALGATVSLLNSVLGWFE